MELTSDLSLNLYLINAKYNFRDFNVIIEIFSICHANVIQIVAFKCNIIPVFLLCLKGNHPPNLQTCTFLLDFLWVCPDTFLCLYSNTCMSSALKADFILTTKSTDLLLRKSVLWQIIKSQHYGFSFCILKKYCIHIVF